MYYDERKDNPVCEPWAELLVSWDCIGIIPEGARGQRLGRSAPSKRIAYKSRLKRQGT